MLGKKSSVKELQSYLKNHQVESEPLSRDHHMTDSSYRSQS